MIVRVQVRKHGHPPLVPGEDWRTNVCMVDLLCISFILGSEQVVVRSEPEGLFRTGGLKYAWTVTEWDGQRLR